MTKKILKFFLYILIFLLLVVTSISLHRTWDRLNPIDYWRVKYGLDDFIAPRALPKAHKIATPEFIAHAGGEIDGIPYTNSREAILKSIKLGYKFIEIDFKETLEGELFGAHSVKEFRKWTSLPALGHIPPTIAEVKSVKIHGKYTPIFLREIFELLKEHPDVYLVTDKTRNYEALLEQFPLPQQLIVETFYPQQYYRALKAGIWYPTFLGNTQALYGHKATLAVIARERWERDPEIRKWAAKANHTAIISTSNDCRSINFPQGTLAYSDRCIPKR